MNQIQTQPNQSQTKMTSKSFNKKILHKLNQSINAIASKAFQSQQCDKLTSFYSKNMLCTARNTPQIQPFTSRQNQSQIQTLQKRNSTQKISKKVRLLCQDQLIQNQNPLSKTVDGKFYSGSQNEQQLFLTMQGSFNYSSGSKQFASMTQTQRIPKIRSKLNINRKWTFQDFLNNLYLEKTKDLRTKPNPKQQKLFVQRFKQKFQIYSHYQISSALEYGKQGHCVIKDINVTGCDFGLNAIRCICEFILSNKLVRMSIGQIHTFCNVKTIVLDKNPLGDQAITVLAQTMNYFTILQRLSMVSVNMSPKGAKQLLRGLMGHQSLTYVNFSSQQGLNRNRFGDSIRQMQLVLNHPSFSWQYLNLSNTNIGQNGLNMISNGISKQSSLKQLLLSQNDILGGDIQYFLFRFKLSNLLLLDLSNNEVGDQGFRQIIQIIGCQYGHNSLSRSLKILNLSNNQIRSYGIQYYCKNMFNNQSLIQLNLSNNNLSKGQLFFNFKYYISKNWTLKKLNISNSFTDQEDLRHLFEGLQENRALQQLKVNKNNFSLENFSAMAKMLTINKSLKSLQCQSCNISDKFVQKSQKDLKQVRNIQQLNLNNNYLGDKSGKILLQMISKSKSIIKLTLLKNCLSVKYQNEIGSFLRSNRNRKQHSKIDQKQMQYLNYVSEIQNNHQQNIKTTIQKLRQKQSKAKLSSLVCQVVKVQLQQEQRKKQMHEQMNKIKQLQQKLKKKPQHNVHHNVHHNHHVQLQGKKYHH